LPRLKRLPDVTGKQPFEKLVSEHGPAVLRVCRAVVGPVDADDAWSETFLSALQAYPKLPADANVEAWLVTIAHRKAIDVIRRTRRAAVPVADVTAAAAGGAVIAGHAVAAGAGPDSPDGRDLDLPGSLARLPERQRFAVSYHYLAGLPYAEVAAIIGGTAEAARRAASDGIANLRKTHGTVR
jgi:DNA-directed RNA polymerase specialized sigma24 family protein